MNTCKTCTNYEKGFDGKPGLCTKLVIGDVYNGYDNLPKDGIGYSDREYSREFAHPLVGEDFGCIHYAVQPSIH